MAIRYYIVPTLSNQTEIVPKYFCGDNPDQNDPYSKYVKLIAGSYDVINYGLEPLMLIIADVTNAEHTSIAANTDVVAAPLNINNTIGGNLATVQSKLEAVNIPADWITSGMTYKTVLRWVARLFLIMQRFHGKGFGRLLQSLTLTDLVSDIPSQKRQNLNTAAQELGLDTSGITGSMTIRNALKNLGNQISINISGLE